MKKLLLLFFLFASLTLLAQQNNEWEDWQKTSCYSKISFRMKSEPKNGEQYHWKIQFKSDYSQLVSFNYHVTDKLEQYCTTTHRKTMNAKQLSDTMDIYTKSGDIFLLVDKLSLSAFPKDFEDCDN